MFLEKHSRFFRKYEFRFSPRHKKAAYLPLHADGSNYNVAEALSQILDTPDASEEQPNGDVVELIEVSPLPTQGVVVLLFHRASPNAADPTYRRKAKSSLTTRVAAKEPGEEQSVSAHVIIGIKELSKGTYSAVLEEIPGMSMGVLRPIIAQALNKYPYEFRDKKGNVAETYCTFKPLGVKSETITNALKTGRLKTVTLVRPARPGFVDADGIFEPLMETMKMRIRGDFDNKTWGDKFKALAGSAKAEGWEDVTVDIDLGDRRSRTVKLDRDEEAKEILFVRSIQVGLRNALPVCSTAIQPELVSKAISVMAES